MSDLRVRFAPSPTGYLHIGGARTALFNWLWARKHGGRFILRVEDTDQARNTEQSVAAIFESMSWLGLDWDEGPGLKESSSTLGNHGPYFQSQRSAIYQEHIERLVASGGAYRCYCTKEELASMREAHAATGSKDPWRYPGVWRERSDWPEDQPYVVRLKTPTEGVTAWNDLVKGRIEVPNHAQQDVVLMRAGGIPLYNLSAAVDDATMGITLVARGDDHVVNTPVQIMVLRALGYPVPQYAHLPMILAPNGEKLSKRHASVSVLDYREQGFLPQGVLNYLARLGWSHGDQEIFSKAELIELFNWEHVGNTGARYDLKKFSHVQATQLRNLSNTELLTAAADAFKDESVDVSDTAQAIKAIETVKTRATTLKEVASMCRFYFAEPVFEDKATAKFLSAKSVPFLQGLISMLESINTFTAEKLEEHIREALEQREWKLKDVAQPARVALTGTSKSPGLYEMMEVLGKTTTLQRLQQGLEIAQK